MQRILIIKTGALGDVLRSTSLLEGIHARWPGAEVIWVTGKGAEPLIANHPLVTEVIAIDPCDCADELSSLAAVGPGLILSLDDDPSLCALVHDLAQHTGAGLIGACLDGAGKAGYTDEAECWFGMGLLSRDGLAVADKRKLANRRTHGDLLAEVVGVEPGKPALHLSPDELARGAHLLEGLAPAERGLRIGLNTGAGGRWRTKSMQPQEVVALVSRLHSEFASASGPGVQFLLLGGEEERQRNQDLMTGAGAASPQAILVDTGCDHSLLSFGALVAGLDLLVTSDSLALHMAVALEVKTVAFFAPTSPWEIDLFGRGEKVVSTAPDAGNYARDTSNSTITGERVAEAAIRQLV